MESPEKSYSQYFFSSFDCPTTVISEARHSSDIDLCSFEGVSDEEEKTRFGDDQIDNPRESTLTQGGCGGKTYLKSNLEDNLLKEKNLNAQHSVAQT